MEFQVTQKVLFKHCDPAGIVFYPRYLEMVNDAVEAFFSGAIGYAFEDVHKTHAVPTVQLDASFKAVSRHGDLLTLTVQPTRVGRASLDLEVKASCGTEARFAVQVTLVHVSNAMKSEPWPDPVREKLFTHLIPQEQELSHG